MTEAAKPVDNGAAKKTTPTSTSKTEKTNASSATKDAFGAGENFAKAAQDQIETFFSAFTENAENVRTQTDDMVKAVRENFETTTERFQPVNAELMNFAREEVTDAVDFANELSRAKTMADALEIQRDYWTNLFQTRMERAREMTETTVKAAQESFEPMNAAMTASLKTDTFSKMFPMAGPFTTK